VNDGERDGHEAVKFYQQPKRYPVDQVNCCNQKRRGEKGMDTDQMAAIIRKRLKLEESEWSIIERNSKFQQLFKSATEASKYRLIAEVVESKGCHSGHVVGQKLVFDNTGNLLTKENPDRVCSFLMPNLAVLINAFFENLMNGRNPNEVMFNTTGCFDTGPCCGGWGHIVVKMTAERRS
jgi:hypothetical protein